MIYIYIELLILILSRVIANCDSQYYYRAKRSTAFQLYIYCILRFMLW